jgi:hypothetical protein
LAVEACSPWQYSIRNVYRKLTTKEVLSLDATSELIWHKQVPLKVSNLAWRILRNRLATKDSFVARGIISHENQLAWLGVGIWRLLIIYFSLVPISILYGVLSGHGLAFHRLIRTVYRIMLFSLFILQEGHEFGVPLCNMFGYVAYEFCGMKEIIKFSRIRKASFTNC